MEREREMASAAKKPTLSTDQEEEQQGLDFISLLPDEILHIILSKLQIRDAAVTTAVSKRWSPLFPTLPSLHINGPSFSPRVVSDPMNSEFRAVNSVKWINALFSVLDSRKTAIKRFDIAVDRLEPNADDFYEVFRDVCVAGVEELLITHTNFHWLYQIPSPVFACNTIVKLFLDSCRLVVLSNLIGLRAVKTMVLMTVSVADDHLRRMISHCKELEKLVITDCLKAKNIVICAPSLSELAIKLYRPTGVVLKNVPRLASVTVSFDYCSDPWRTCYRYVESDSERSDDEESDSERSDDEESDSEKTFEGTNEATNLLAFLNGLRRVKDLHLTFSDKYRMMLSKGGMALPTRLSPKCYLVELNKLCLSLPFNDITFNMIISCLLNSSPHLMEVIILVDTVYDEYFPNALEFNIWEKQLPAECVKHQFNALEFNFWEKQVPAECVKHHLKTATFYLEYLSEDCFGFPKFLLRNAGNLKSMNVFYYGKLKRIPNTAEKIIKELFVLQMASPDVEIMVKPISSRLQAIYQVLKSPNPELFYFGNILYRPMVLP